MVEDEPLLTARANAADLGGTVPVAPAVGAALRFLAAAIGARAVVEIGTGCGSSGIWLLRGMRPGAVLTSVDTEPEYHRLARKSFAQAGFATNQARLILGRALDVLPRLSDGAYDLVFCDADQAHYPDYLTAGLRLLRVGGIVVFNDALPPSAGRPRTARANWPTWSPPTSGWFRCCCPSGAACSPQSKDKTGHQERARGFASTAPRSSASARPMTQA